MICRLWWRMLDMEIHWLKAWPLKQENKYSLICLQCAPLEWHTLFWDHCWRGLGENTCTVWQCWAPLHPLGPSIVWNRPLSSPEPAPQRGSPHWNRINKWHHYKVFPLFMCITLGGKRQQVRNDAPQTKHMHYFCHDDRAWYMTSWRCQQAKQNLIKAWIVCYKQFWDIFNPPVLLLVRPNEHV